MTMTKGQVMAEDVAALLRARNPLLWIVTREEARIERLLVEAAGAAGYVPYVWDVADGATEIGKNQTDATVSDVDAILGRIKQRTTSGQRCAWIMRDLPPWFRDPLTMRRVRNLARILPSIEKKSAQCIIIVTPSAEVPPELAGHATVIEAPLPDRAEIEAILDATINVLPEFETGEDGKPDPKRPLRSRVAQNGTRAAAIDAAVGLTGLEAQACYARSLVQNRDIDPRAVAKEKRLVISRERVLEWFDPLPGGLDAVGGLDNLKTWILQRGQAYSAAARQYGLKAPKGVVLVGVQGCGKSLTAKATATALQCPLLRLDMGALKGKFVGESEANIRKAFRVIESVGRCVVWIDEIEKAMAGAASGGAADGGVSADALGVVLNWMQERTSEAFVIATANDITNLPPELLRKGRFDEIFFVDIPNVVERAAILRTSLVANKRDTAAVNLDAVAAATDGFIGAEIAELVPDAMFTAFGDGAREITTEDIIAAARAITPLTKTAEKKITALRDWAKGNARAATSPLTAPAASRAERQLDF